jgi:hypothetical protein
VCYLHVEETSMKRAMRLIFSVFVLLMTTAITASADRSGSHGGGGFYSYQGGGGGGAYGYHGGGGWPRYYGGSAWGGSGYYGGFWGGPGWGVWGPGWWGPSVYPFYYVTPPVVIEQQPRTFIESTPAPEEQGYWYYCQNPPGYYPYVKRCSKGWMKVVPTPDTSDGDEGDTAVPSPLIPNSKE